jgi:nucleoid-associated protein YgaU
LKGTIMILTHQVVAGDTLSALAQRFYGDSSLYRVIAVHNQIADPDNIQVGQELEIPYVTYRHRVVAGDTTQSVAQQYYQDIATAGVIEVANHAGQRDLVPGEWLLIPDLANVYHHAVTADETLQILAERWYGESGLWPIIAIANHLGDDQPPPGHVLIQPQLNRRHHVVAGDTLWQLAADQYGDDGVAAKAVLVAAANHIADPDVIVAGSVIYFPSLWRP